MGTAHWDDAVEEVLGGDLTAGLAYATPAGGCVVTPVATVGLRDREQGTVSFTTSLGFGKKLERLRRNPRVALAYHARDHGFASSPAYVLVQGRASLDLHPDRALLETTVQPAAERFLGHARTGFFWDGWLREYYEERVLVTVGVSRILVWPDLRCAGEVVVTGDAAAGPPRPQAPPKGGTGSRVDAARAARRLGKLSHCLVAYLDGDGMPMVLPVAAGPPGTRPVVDLTCAAPLPAGGRRAGLLAHSYRAQLVGLAVRQHTGWLEVDDGPHAGTYAPHTAKGFMAPPNKTLLLLVNGLLAKQGLRRARKAVAATPAGAG